MENDELMSSFAPVPVSVGLEAGMINGQPAVIVKWKTPDNVSVTFWEPSALDSLADEFHTIATRAKTGLIIPGGNGAGVTDLRTFKDQGENVDEVDVPSSPGDDDVAE